jgi:hypothetical protein
VVGIKRAIRLQVRSAMSFPSEKQELPRHGHFDRERNDKRAHALELKLLVSAPGLHCLEELFDLPSRAVLMITRTRGNSVKFTGEDRA